MDQNLVNLLVKQIDNSRASTEKQIDSLKTHMDGKLLEYQKRLERHMKKDEVAHESFSKHLKYLTAGIVAVFLVATGHLTVAKAGAVANGEEGASLLNWFLSLLTIL